MNKKEFLEELENALAGRLSQSDVREIITDYGDVFENAVSEGKSEETAAAEIGSPARIARTILEDSGDAGSGVSGNRKAPMDSAEPGRREYTDFQRSINEKTSRIFDKIVDPDKNVPLERLAPMSRRLGAYLIDSLLLSGVVLGAIFAVLAPLSYHFMMKPSSSVVINTMDLGGSAMTNGMLAVRGISSGLAIGNVFILMFLFGAFNLITTIILWATNGYTPGKWFLKMRVIKINGGKISFLDAVLRELVIKCIANSILSGVLNLGSFIWGCTTEDHKTVHDLVAQTRVVEWDRNDPQKASEPMADR